ncbi:MAG: ImmA/IrrE family metallo-endopeptidase [Clostridia bacterium]|nr:ImmA/IrrE family metallo-endopeptidase [Clostridia bacterium]
MNGLYLDFIIHPGETIKDLLDDRNMKQEELSIRTGFSPKHVSEVINGKKGISPAFAKSLQYVFGINASFFMNLQNQYDEEILRYKEQEEIDSTELKIVKELKGLIKYAKENNIINVTSDKISEVIELRKLCHVTNLTFIKNLPLSEACFRKSNNVNTNVNMLYVWMRICEELAKKNKCEQKYNDELLIKKIENIKKCMFMPINKAINELTKIFNSCGIIFQVVKNFTGVPVQGFINREDDKIVLTITTRGAYLDIFYFTLFHEIGHILNKDIDSNYVDFYDSESRIEKRANNYARNVLINDKAFNNFVKKEFISKKDVLNFAKEQDVKPYIVVSRLQNAFKNYKMFSELREKCEI